MSTVAVSQIQPAHAGWFDSIKEKIGEGSKYAEEKIREGSKYADEKARESSYQAQEKYDQGKQWVEQERRDAEQWVEQERRDAEQWVEQERRDAEQWVEQERRDAEQKTAEIKSKIASADTPQQRYDVAKDVLSDGYKFVQKNAKLDLELLENVYEKNPYEYSTILYKNDDLRNYEVQQQKQALKDQLEQIKKKHSSIFGQYKAESWNLLSESSERQAVAMHSSYKDLSALEKSLEVVDESTVLLFKMIPVYDTKTKKVTTLDSSAKRLTSAIPRLSGSNIADDPVRAGVMIMTLDADYLLYAKLIHAPDGNWISVEEASTIGYKKHDAKKMKTAIKAISIASNARDPVKLVKNINTLAEIADDVNRNKEHEKVYEQRKNGNLFSPITIPILQQMHGTPAPDDTVPILDRLETKQMWIGIGPNSVELEIQSVPISEVVFDQSKSLLSLPKYEPQVCHYTDERKNCCISDNIKTFQVCL